MDKVQLRACLGRLWYRGDGVDNQQPERMCVRRNWRIPDEMWERVRPLLPPRKAHRRRFQEWARAGVFLGL